MSLRVLIDGAFSPCLAGKPRGTLPFGSYFDTCPDQIRAQLGFVVPSLRIELPPYQLATWCEVDSAHPQNKGSPKSDLGLNFD